MASSPPPRPRPGQRLTLLPGIASRSGTSEIAPVILNINLGFGTGMACHAPDAAEGSRGFP